MAGDIGRVVPGDDNLRLDVAYSAGVGRSGLTSRSKVTPAPALGSRNWSLGDSKALLTKN